MPKASGKTALTIVISGTTSGFGLAAAELLARAGHRVYGLSIDAKPMRTDFGDGFLQQLKTDVGKDDSVEPVISEIILLEKGIDVLVNNAGIGLAGAVEETTVDEARALFEVNLWGMLRLVRAVVPGMKNRGSGKIINISSYGGLFAIPFQGFYSAAKYAVEGFSESLSMELRPFGIQVYLIEPGDGATKFHEHRRFTEQSTHSAYEPVFGSIMRTVVQDEINGFAPARIGQRILRIVSRRRDRFRHIVGNPLQGFLLRFKLILPYRLFETVALSMFGASTSDPPCKEFQQIPVSGKGSAQDRGKDIIVGKKSLFPQGYGFRLFHAHSSPESLSKAPFDHFVEKPQ